MKTSLKVLSLGLLLLSGVGFVVAKNNTDNIVNEVNAIGNYSTDANTYYSEITATSGKQLAAQLHDLITSTHRYYTSYDDNGKNAYQQQTDQYYENDNPVEGSIYEFYSGAKWSNVWRPNDTGGYNREHCWCQSNSVNTAGHQMWGTDGGGADMHHLRPVEKDLNSTRNNHPYGEVTNRDNYKKYPKLPNGSYSDALGGYMDGSADIFEPIDSKKGDVARIILYTYLHYNSYTITELFDNYGTTNGNGNSSYFSSTFLSLTKTTKHNTESAALEMLLRWNTNDPVDDIERRRNEQVAIYQGNRNPFIDNSDYADAIWGDTPTAGITSISKSTASLTEGNTTTISAVSSNGGTISWSSDDTDVATVSAQTAPSGGSIVVTAVAAGSATVTASITISGHTYSKSCLVTVTSSGGGGGGGGSGSTITFTRSDFAASYPQSTASLEKEGYNFSFADVGNFSTSIQFKKNAGRLYNTDSLGTISSISITEKDGGSHDNLKVGFGDTQEAAYSNASSGSPLTTSGVNGNNKSYFCIANGNSVANIASITITYTPPAPKTLSSIELSGQTTSFAEGDDFVFGGTVTARYSDDSTENVTAHASFSGYSMTELGVQQITVTYKDKTAQYNITINQGTLASIGIYGYTQEYYKKDTFSFDGTCVATFANEYDKVVEPTSVSSPDMTTTGEKVVTVSYTYNGNTESTQYTINVIPAILMSIDINTTNVQKEFTVGDTFTYAGLVVTGHYHNSTTDVIESGYDVSTPDMSSEGEKVVTVSIDDKSQTYTITVNAPIVDDHGKIPGDPLTVTEAIAVCEETGNVNTAEDYYTQGIVSQIKTAYSEEYGNISFKISADGETSGDQLLVYRCKYLNGAKFTSADQLQVGMEVIIVGKLINYQNNTPEYAADCYVYQYVNGGGEGQTSLSLVMSQQGYTNGQTIESLSFYNQNGQTITGTFTKGTGNNDTKYYDTGTAVRFYAGNTLTITSSKANLKSIVLGFGSGGNSNEITTNVGTYSNGTWTGSASSVVFTVGGETGNRRISSITISYFNATDFANYFLDNIGCDNTGRTTPTGSWSTMNEKYNLLFTEDQNTLKGASANESGIAIEKAVARYDYIVRKYGSGTYANFISRNGLSANPTISIIKDNETNIMSLVIIVSLISITSVGAFLFIRHKKVK